MHSRMPRRLLFYSNDICNVRADFCSAAAAVSAPRTVFALVEAILCFYNAILAREPKGRKMRAANISQLRHTCAVTARTINLTPRLEGGKNFLFSKCRVSTFEKVYEFA